MTPARRPRPRAATRLLRIDPCGDAFGDAAIGDLPALLRAGDLLVVNDAATLPASLGARTAGGEAVELRLAGAEHGEAEFPAVLFGAGDWRQRTEDRPAPPAVAVGERLRVGGAGGLVAEVVAVSPISPRLVTVRFAARGAALWRSLYAVGRPVQYSHVAAPLALWDVQTSYGARPWAVEAPSAGLPLDGATLVGLRARGVRLATLTHAAGLSATGDAALDAALPLPERYDVPAQTVAAIAAARARGGRVVAVGTTVVRALEGNAAAHGGDLVAGEGVTDLKIHAGFRPRVVDGLVTGLHDAGTSHVRLLTAWVAERLLAAAYDHAGRAGYLNHELGDASLVLCG